MERRLVRLLYLELVVPSGPLLAMARGGKPSGSVARMPLDPMLAVSYTHLTLPTNREV